jgi:hypothetical protein
MTQEQNKRLFFFNSYNKFSASRGLSASRSARAGGFLNEQSKLRDVLPYRASARRDSERNFRRTKIAFGGVHAVRERGWDWEGSQTG